jgi:plasmid replication initiation protein
VEKLDCLLERLQKRAATKGSNRVGEGGQRQLLPDRHPTRDFFIADILDCALKDDHHTMEHPIFSLAKNPDREITRYEHNGNTITIAPSAYGRANIWDKDVLLYAVSQLVEAMNRGMPIGRVIRLTAHDFLVSTNRTTGGRSYEELKATLERLRGTSITTNIVTNGIRQTLGFGLIDNWEIVQRAPSGRMSAVTITLNEWLFNAVLANEVLTLNREYFRLSGGLERRLYELGRKHCGRQPRWTISLPVLHTKSGAKAVLFRFRQMIRAATAANALPDYILAYDRTKDSLTFQARSHV